MNRNNILTNAQITLEFEQLKTSVKGKDFVLYPEQCTFL